MRKYVIIAAIIVVVAFVFVPPAINFWVSTPSAIGFIPVEKQDTWIGFYAAIIGGCVTLAGVVITILYNERSRKDDLAKREKEQKAEFDRKNMETKMNLAAQFKPILTVSFDPSTRDIREYWKKKNILNLTEELPPTSLEQKRMVLNLVLSNIGRGEARNLKICSTVFWNSKNKWETVIREYDELYVENDLDVMLYKELTADDWVCHDNMYLEKPMNVVIEVLYDDLVGFHHKLESVVTIGRFINIKNEDGEIIPNVLVLNPFDSKISNRTKSE